MSLGSRADRSVATLLQVGGDVSRRLPRDPEQLAELEGVVGLFGTHQHGENRYDSFAMSSLSQVTEEQKTMGSHDMVLVAARSAEPPSTAPTGHLGDDGGAQLWSPNSLGALAG